MNEGTTNNLGADGDTKASPTDALDGAEIAAQTDAAEQEEGNG